MTTIVTIDMGGTGATHAAGARSALSAAHENAYAQANAAYEKANTASSTGGGGYDQANAAYTQANNARADANTTFGTVNTTFLTINTTFGTINTSLSTMNLNLSGAQAWSNIVSFAAYGQANTARSDANTTFTTINTTFATVNTTFGTINTNYQAAYAQANTARGTANDAYGAANTKLSTSGGSISGDLSITGNLTVQGNATTINVSNLAVNDSIILLATGGTGDSTDIGFIGHIQRDSTNTHVGLIRKATENRFYLFDNYEVEPTNNVIDVAGQNFRVGNLRLGIINANSYVTSAGLDVTGQANAAYGQANTARSDANTTFATINTTFGTINTTFGTVNTSLGTINTSYQAAYAQANTAGTNALNAYGQANAAYGAANNRVLKAGDTMTGQLNISSGGLLVTGDVGFGSSPAFTTGSGLEIQRATATATLRLDSSSFATELYGYTGGTGLFQLSAGYLDLGTNNTTRLRITSDGNVGIGITTPNTVFNIYGGTSGNKTDLLAMSHPAGAGAQPVLRFDTIPANDNVLGRLSVKDAGSYAGDMIFEVAATKGAASTTTTERMVIKNDGNVGIGTTNPGAKLEIKGSGDGDLFIGRYSGGSAKLIYGYQSASDGFLELRTAADTTVTKLSGYTGTSSYFLSAVGIGTTSPGFKLDVFQSTNDTTIRTRTSGAGAWFEARDETSYFAGVRHVAVNGARYWLTGMSQGIEHYCISMSSDGGTNRFLTINTSGNVGIGTTDPSGKLHVSSGTSGNAIVIIEADTDNNNEDDNPKLWFKADGGLTEAAIQKGDNTLDIISNVVSGSGIRFFVGANTITGTTDPITGATQRMVIDANGNVGIGTTNPSTRLHVYNTSGDVELRLSADGSSNPIFRMTGENNGTSEGLTITYVNDIGDTYFNNIYTGASGAFRFQTGAYGSGTERFTILTNGNVGVGNNAPDFKTIIQSDITKSGDINPGSAHLSLQGNSDVRKRMILGYDTNSNGFGFIKAGFYNNTWTTLSLQPDGGNVGIGTTSGAEKLHVVGNIVATGSITASYSDARFKDIIGRIENPLQIISNIDAIFYRPNELVKSKYPEQEDRVFVGVTAQSVKEVLPEVVVPSPIDPEYDTVHYDRLVPVLIAAIQEQQKQIDELKSRLSM